MKLFAPSPLFDPPEAIVFLIALRPDNSELAPAAAGVKIRCCAVSRQTRDYTAAIFMPAKPVLFFLLGTKRLFSILNPVAQSCSSIPFLYPVPLPSPSIFPPSRPRRRYAPERAGCSALSVCARSRAWLRLRPSVHTYRNISGIVGQ
jgi:hypothetical protein